MSTAIPKRVDNSAALFGTGDEETESEKEKKIASALPEPKGWRMLIALPEVEKVSDGGIIKPDSFRHLEETSTVLGYVLKMGPMCFSDTERFGQEPWCKEGDFVLLGAYKGVRFHVFGKEFRIINDDTVQAVVAEPRGYTRS